MHRFPFATGLIAVAVLVAGACHRAAPSGEYLFVWAGDSARAASDFLVVVDANPSSTQYGTVLATLPTGVVGAYPHHTEAEMPSDGHLLANGFGAGRTWLFDLTSPRQPKLLTSFGDVAGLSHPHTYTRLANGNVLRRFSTPRTNSRPLRRHHRLLLRPRPRRRRRRRKCPCLCQP